MTDKQGVIPLPISNDKKYTCSVNVIHSSIDNNNISRDESDERNTSNISNADTIITAATSPSISNSSKITDDNGKVIQDGHSSNNSSSNAISLINRSDSTNNNIDISNKKKNESTNDSNKKNTKMIKLEHHRKRPELQHSNRFGWKDQTVAFVILDDGFLEECIVDDALNRKDDKSYWVHFEVYDDDEIQDFYDTYVSCLPDLTKFMKQHMSQVSQYCTPQVLPVSKSAFVVVRSLHPTDNSRLDQHEVAICTPGLLLTLTTEADLKRRSTLNLKKETIEYMCERELPESSTSGIFAVWLSFHVERLAKAVNKLRMEVFDLLEKADDDDIHTIENRTIIEMKDQTLHLLSIAEEQDQITETLVQSDSITDGFDFDSFTGTIGVMRMTAAATARQTIRLEKRVADVRQAYDSYQADRMNSRLAVLTIVSVIFMPITFMAGIWGMNFDNIPELHEKNGYFIGLGSMAAIAAALLLLFWRRGWFTVDS